MTGNGPCGAEFPVILTTRYIRPLACTRATLATIDFPSNLCCNANVIDRCLRPVEVVHAVPSLQGERLFAFFVVS